MRDYSTTSNGFRINSSSSILLDNQQFKQKIPTSELESHPTNGDVNYYRRNNGVIGSDFDAITTITNATIDTLNEHPQHGNQFMNEIKPTTVNSQPKSRNYTLWIATPVAARY